MYLWPTPGDPGPLLVLEQGPRGPVRVLAVLISAFSARAGTSAPSSDSNRLSASATSSLTTSTPSPEGRHTPTHTVEIPAHPLPAFPLPSATASLRGKSQLLEPSSPHVPPAQAPTLCVWEPQMGATSPPPVQRKTQAAERSFSALGPRTVLLPRGTSGFSCSLRSLS